MMIKKVTPKFDTLAIQYTGQTVEELNKLCSSLLYQSFYKNAEGHMCLDSSETYDIYFEIGDWLIFDTNNDIYGIYTNESVETNFVIGENICE